MHGGAVIDFPQTEIGDRRRPKPIQTQSSDDSRGRSGSLDLDVDQTAILLRTMNCMGLQNVDDLYSTLGALDNMLDEYEAGSSTDNLKPPQYRSISAARPSETVIPTTSVADIATPPRQRFIVGMEGGLD
ncbi:hypothetical protein LWI28_008232 [Acer negundo]|uniref:Uncharacterized protein n=1 Tax=Acer negundo TaxID=4023 RepID=A0AAD5IZB1_ACENE|nr:hypothetical protein LWI28_008232 [Acer negundo]